MTETVRRDPYLEPDEATRHQVRRLARAAGHGALSCLEPDTGDPIVSRVSVGHLPGGAPLLLVSDLSPHSRALDADGRCSLLLGEPGSGDPLAHPRLMVKARAHPLPNDDAEASLARARFLQRHPKAALYVDFADFRFLRLDVVSALFNAGFARAYRLAATDVTESVPAPMREVEARVRSHMNEDHGDAIDALLARDGASGTGWRIATLDPLGFEALRGGDARRIEFLEPVEAPAGYREAFVRLVRDAEA